MNEAVLESRTRWTIALIGGGALLLVLLVLFRLSVPTVPLARPLEPAPPKAVVQMARPTDADLLLKAEAELRDLRPLFLPTERNAALPEPRLEPGRSVHDNELPKLTFGEAEARISRSLPPVVTLNGRPVAEATPADVLSPKESDLALQGFGRAAAPVSILGPRGGYVEVTALATGERVLGAPLPVAARPLVEKTWAPVEYMAAVDAAGLVSPLIVTAGSRVDEVDAHFRDYLAQTFRIGERLAPGFYRISVAP